MIFSKLEYVAVKRLKLPMPAESAARATRENVTPRRRFFPAFFCLVSTILRSSPPTLRTSGHYVRQQVFSLRHAGLQRWLYEYHRLEYSTSIRVLELLPDKQGAPLRRHIRDVLLDDVPDYEAISYVWGPPDFVKKFFATMKSFQS